MEQLDLELDPLVLVLKCVVLDVVEGVWTVGPELDEVVFSQVSECAVVLTLDRCSSQAREEQGNLSEEITLLKWQGLGVLLPHVIDHNYIACALGDEVDVVHWLLGTLRDDVFLRQRQHQIDMRDHELNDLCLL